MGIIDWVCYSLRVFNFNGRISMKLYCQKLNLNGDKGKNSMVMVVSLIIIIRQYFVFDYGALSLMDPSSPGFSFFAIPAKSFLISAIALPGFKPCKIKIQSS